jgi:hypothetical protein
MTLINPHTFKTLSFVVLVATNIAAWLATLGNTVTTDNAWLFTVGSAGLYALARGLAKFDADTKNFWQTTEFYVVLIGAAAAMIAASQGHMSDTRMKELLAGLAAALSIARGLALAPSTQLPPQ